MYVKDIVRPGTVSVVKCEYIVFTGRNIISDRPIASVSEPDCRIILPAHRKEETLRLKSTVKNDTLHFTYGRTGIPVQYDFEDALSDRSRVQRIRRNLTQGMYIPEILRTADAVYPSVGVGIIVEACTVTRYPYYIPGAFSKCIYRIFQKFTVGGHILHIRYCFWS